MSAAPAVSGHGVQTNTAARFEVKSYQVSGSSLLTPNDLANLFAPHTGTNVSLDEIVKAAGDLHQEFRRIGYPLMSVAFAPDQISNGIVTFNVFQTAVPQVVVSGHSFLSFPEDEAVAAGKTAAPPVATSINTNPPVRMMASPATPAQVAEEREALRIKMEELAVQEKDHRIHVVPTPGSTNHFAINKYLVDGNTILSATEIGGTLTNIDGVFGTNVTLDGVRTVVTELQKAYQERGYVTVAVGLPPQKLTNATIKVHVTEGRLVAIDVTGNHYFSSNNVMRALPSLHTNMLLNGPIFQSEMNRANANQDRQIYPVIGPGPDVGTSKLTLKVKDQLPVHGKTDLDNQSSPGTPVLRENSSVVFNNLWQLEHSLGLQYGFSPESFKEGSQWGPYDQPRVANYSAFYRMPLGGPNSLGDALSEQPGTFGYDEATHKFNLPPDTGRPELTFFASRSTIDPGITTTGSTQIGTTNNSSGSLPGSTNDVYSIQKLDQQQDVTENNDFGLRLNMPLKGPDDWQTSVSGGFDFKIYNLKTFKTNAFEVVNIETAYTQPITYVPVGNTNNSPVPTTFGDLNYLPLSLHYDASTHDFFGTTIMGLGLGANLWYSGSATNLHLVSGSTKTTGHWVTLTPSLTQIITFYTNWVMTVRADGQWSSEPLISNEQFGAGGVNSVRGYREGEVFGDSGWHFSVEQQTPAHLVGNIRGNVPVVIRGSLYMDYAKVYLLDPQGAQQSTPLWGTGFGTVLSIGSHWDAHFLFSLPLLSTATTKEYSPFFNFAIEAQF